MLSEESNQLQGHVMKQSYCYKTEVDYFPVAAWPHVFYSSYTMATYQQVVSLFIKECYVVLFIHE